MKKQEKLKIKVELDNKKALKEIKAMQKIIDKANTVLKKDFKGKWIDKVQKTILKMTGLLFLTFIIGNLLVILGMIDTPSFKDWCQGSMYLLIGGGVVTAGKAYKEKIIDKG